MIKKKKIKFIFTFRIFRLILIDFIFILFLSIFNKYVIYSYSIFTPIVLLIVNLVDIYKYINDNKQLKSAISKLENNKNLITIGITGSNGKTSVKEILFKLLSTKYKVITTQKNQNTPKGSIIAINKFLTNETEIFICEMGARKRGDIAQICNLVNPTKGIITSVAPQHLETFKTEQNIYLTKKELPDYLNKNYCVYNIDNNYVNEMFKTKDGNKSCISIKSKCNLYATNIHISNFTTYFDINYNNQIYPCHTKLLGEHNVTNILLALDIALHLGIEINQAIQTIINLQPTPHRLEYVKSHIDIIDDSYNCSIDSATMALKVLSQISKTKAVCTPGIIEGGKYQFNLNCELSNMLNTTADTIIIVGKTNRKALVSKLNNFELFYVLNSSLKNRLNKSKQINIGNLKAQIVQIHNISNQTKKCAYIVDTLDIAKKLFSKILNNKHVLLLLNDLPDEYN
ncbi:MAG: Mur ligase family protein [Clostridia bacterium]